MLIIQILCTCVLSVIAAVTYRMGGSGNYPRWVRQVGICSAMVVNMIIWGHLHWTLILCFGLLYGLSTTYFKAKGSDAHTWNWLLVGLAFSVSMLPLVIVQGLWFGFILRTALCMGMVAMWSEINGNAVWEECGRGALIILTLPILEVHL